jgi:hypothetical protein
VKTDEAGLHLDFKLRLQTIKGFAPISLHSTGRRTASQAAMLNYDLALVRIFCIEIDLQAGRPILPGNAQ